MIPKLEWVEATTLSEAHAALDGATMIKAGGIDVIDRLKEGLDAPARLLNILNVAGLDGLRDDDTGLAVGPLVTLARLAEQKIVRERYRALADAATHAATPQIRNVATAGGNLLQRPRCWYFRNERFPCLKKGGAECFAQEGENEYHAIFANDTCAAVHASSLGVALVAFNAAIDLAGPKGTRTVPLEGFFTPASIDVSRENALAAGEILTRIHVPGTSAGTTSAYVKIAQKESQDWPLAEVAVVLDRQGTVARRASIVLGAAAHTPLRAKGAEAVLAGKVVTEETAAAAGRAAVAGATPLRDNAYKIPIFETAVKRAILAAAGLTGGA